MRDIQIIDDGNAFNFRVFGAVIKENKIMVNRLKMDDFWTFVGEKDNEIIGLIESNADGIPLLFSDGNAANVGEIYVLPQYRGEGISQDLLQYAEQKLLQSNYQYAWVEHGTANPNARYFWNRHFSTYKYEMIRRIESK